MEKDRTEWLKNRTTGIGGSDSSVILGINPWKSKLELWTEKVTGTMVEKDTPDLHWGKKLEPFIMEEYIEITKREVKAGVYEYENLRSKMYPWMTANLDGVIVNQERGNGVLEMKTKSAFIHWDSLIPDYYYSQVQHYLCVTGLTWASFAVLDFGKKELFWCDVERDEEFIKNLVEEESKFWKLVTDKIPPEVENTESCQNFLKSKYSKASEGKTIDLRNNNSATNWAIHLKQIRSEIKSLEENELECKNNLMAIMEDSELGIGDGYKVTWKSPMDRLVFDIERFQKEHHELYKEYAKLEPQSRRFTVKFSKERN